MIKMITDNLDDAVPELEKEGKSMYYPMNMQGAEGLIVQLLLKYGALPTQFHNPYTTLDRDKFNMLLNGPRCAGEAGKEVRNLSKVVLGAMVLGEEGSFVPKILMTGPSGTGKTSIVIELANAMGVNLIRFLSREVQKDIDDHGIMFGFRDFEAQVNVHMPELDGKLLDARRMAGVQNSWILIDEYPSTSRYTDSLKDLLDQEHSKLGAAIIWIISNDDITQFNPALVERCITVPFGQVAGSAKLSVYRKALEKDGRPTKPVPRFRQVAESIIRYDYSDKTWGQVLQLIPPINDKLTPDQERREAEAKKLADLVIEMYEQLVVNKDNRAGVRSVWRTAEYIKCLVIGHYLIDLSVSLPEGEEARTAFAEVYLKDDIGETIERSAETGEKMMERFRMMRGTLPEIDVHSDTTSSSE